jgi:hypothetical protein
MSREVTKEEPKKPEVVHANINLAIEVINNKLFFIVECPSCKKVFGLELKTVVKFIKQALYATKQNGYKNIGVV